MTIVDLQLENLTPFRLGEDEHWKPYDRSAEFLPLINPINYAFQTNPETTIVKARPISCYKDSLILKVQDPQWKEDWATFYFLYSNENYFQLGNINDSLMAINEHATLDLRKQSIFDYIKLAGYFYVVDETGSRFAIESQDSEFIDFIPYSNALERSRNLKKVKPPLVKGPDKDGAFEIECDLIVMSNHLRATFEVHKDGNILIRKEALITGSGIIEMPLDTVPVRYDDNDSV